jgi:tetratricopeptide (TPR) repeat protein
MAVQLLLGHLPMLRHPGPRDVFVLGLGTGVTAAAERLRPGGVMVQWIHTHALVPKDLALLVATFSTVFPHAEIWAPAYGDIMLMGTRDGIEWDYRRLVERYARVLGVQDDLRSIGLWHPSAVFAAYVLGERQVQQLTAGVARPHADDRPVLEFSTPRALYVDTIGQIDTLLDRLRASPYPRVAGFDPVRDLDADATYLFGFAYASIGQVRHGIPYMERSVAMAPDRPAFRVGLANQYREAGRLRDAEEAYRRALALDPQHVEALTALGEVLLGAGQVRDALALAERASRLAPADARVRALLEKARAALR